MGYGFGRGWLGWGRCPRCSTDAGDLVAELEWQPLNAGFFRLHIAIAVPLAWLWLWRSHLGAGLDGGDIIAGDRQRPLTTGAVAGYIKIIEPTVGTGNGRHEQKLNAGGP